VIKSSRIRRAGHVAHVGEKRVVYVILVGKPEERDHVGDSSVDERTVLRWIFRKWGVGVWTGSSWLSTWTGGGHL
jgi:hypothetical protein